MDHNLGNTTFGGSKSTWIERLSGAILVGLALIVAISATARLDFWQEYFFAGAQPIPSCALYGGIGESSHLLNPNQTVPHKRLPDGLLPYPPIELVTPKPPVRLSYRCPLELPQSVTSDTGVLYLHLGWIFGSHIEIFENNTLRLSFTGPDKPVLALSNTKDHASGTTVITINATGFDPHRLGLMGLQPMVLAQGSQINSRILAVDYALSKDVNLFSVLPSLTIGVILVFAGFLGLNSALLRCTLAFFTFSLLRACLGYFADSLPYDLITNFHLQIPFAIASGTAFVTIMMQGLGIRVAWIRNIMLINGVILVLLLGFYAWDPLRAQSFYALAFAWRRGALFFILMVLFVIGAAEHVNSTSKAPTLEISMGRLLLLTLGCYILALACDISFSWLGMGLRLERYMELLVPFLLAALVFLSLAHAEVSYRQSLVTISQQQAENQKLTGIARTVQMIYHDIRKPFALMRLGLAQRGREAYRDLDEQLSREVSAQTLAIEAMLEDIASIDAQANLRLTPCTLGSILSAVLEVLNNPALGTTHGTRSLLIQYDFAHTKLLMVDAEKIKRLMINLLSNAWEATVHVSTARAWIHTTMSTDGRRIEIEFGNSDSFVPQELRSKLFEPFFTRNKAMGTGLGLSICQKIVKDHGGHIRCSADVNRGTWFGFDLEASPIDANEVPALLAPGIGLGASRPTPSPKIPPEERRSQPFAGVLIEDSLFVQDLWIKHSSEIHWEVFSDPQSFWQVYREQNERLLRLDFIVLDYYFAGFGDTNGALLGRDLRQKGFTGVLVLATSMAPDQTSLTHFDLIVGKDPAACSTILEIRAKQRGKRTSA